MMSSGSRRIRSSRKRRVRSAASVGPDLTSALTSVMPTIASDAATMNKRSLIASVVVHAGFARLLRESEEREGIPQRHVIGVHVIGQRLLIEDEEEEGVDHVI